MEDQKLTYLLTRTCWRDNNKKKQSGEEGRGYLFKFSENVSVFRFAKKEEETYK